MDRNSSTVDRRGHAHGMDPVSTASSRVHHGLTRISNDADHMATTSMRIAATSPTGSISRIVSRRTTADATTVIARNTTKPRAMAIMVGSPRRAIDLIVITVGLTMTIVRVSSNLTQS